MAERAHPDHPGFQDKWQFHLSKGIIPWFTVKQSHYRKEFLWRYQWANRFCRNRDVLDIPCGMGWGTSYLKGSHTLTGVDISSEAINEAKSRYRGHADFRVGDMAEIPFDDCQFDVVVCLEGIEHVPTNIGTRFVSEAARVLRPNGILLLSSPYSRTKEHSGNRYHIKEYRPHELITLLEPHFVVTDTTIKAHGNGDIIVSYVEATRMVSTQGTHTND